MLRTFQIVIKQVSRTMSQEVHSLRNKSWAAVCQITANNNCNHNKDLCTGLIEEAAEKGAEIVFLPECFDFVPFEKTDSRDLAEPLDGPTISHYKELACEKKVWLSLGGFHEKIPDQHQVHMSHILIDSLGEVRSVYRKTHLFKVDIPGEVSLNEHDTVLAGNQILPPVRTPIGNLGLQICYDLRFPELSLVQRQQGAHVLTFPSAFTQKTGTAHWHVLLRARAVENQCYVIAAAQTGVHSSRRSSYGHALAVDPWGTVIGECGEGNGFCLVPIDLDVVERVRERMPVSAHRRYDLYNPPIKE